MSDAPRIFTSEYYARMRALEQGSWWNAGMRDVAAAMLGRAELHGTGNMLDVGCGSGQTMQWFGAMYPAWTKSGVDVALEAVTAARSAGLAAAVGSALALPIDPASADLVITLDVLQHLPLPDGDSVALAEVYQVLRPGGVLFVRTNCQSYPRTIDDAAYNFRKYEPQHLNSKLKKCGFDILLMSRANAMLGFAEIGREMRATKTDGAGYHGILAVPSRNDGLAFAAKRATLRAEGRLIAAGATLPFGRSIVALCRKPRNG